MGLIILLIPSAMGATLFWFFRRLRKIEMATWGDRTDTEGLRAFMQRRRRNRAERVVKE